MASLEEGNKLRVWNIEEAQSVLADEPERCSALAFSPVGGSDPRIQIWDVDLRRKVALLEGHVQDVDFLTFHPGGELLASGSWDGMVRLWDPATGRQVMQIPLSGNLQFSKDGRWLGFPGATDEQGHLLEVAPSQALASRRHLGKTRKADRVYTIDPLHFTTIEERFSKAN